MLYHLHFKSINLSPSFKLWLTCYFIYLLNEVHTGKYPPFLKSFSNKILWRSFLLCSQGPPHHLVVKPTDEVCIENGTSAGFRVEVQDEFHNVTTHSSLIVRCQVTFPWTIYTPQTVSIPTSVWLSHCWSCCKILNILYLTVTASQ